MSHTPCWQYFFIYLIPVNQSFSVMKKHFLLSWSLLNGLGLGIAFVVSLQLGMILEYGFNSDMYWKFVPPKRNFWTFLDLFLGAISLGLVVGLFQSWVLRFSGISSKKWVLITILGFGILAIINLPIYMMDMIGKFEGPIEPIMITVLGSTLAGIVQFRFLRTRYYLKIKWLLLLILGLILGTVLFGIFITFFGEKLKISWPMEAFLNGFFVGTIGALLSGQILFKAVGQNKA